ncbi:YkoF family thiamine/hydroxymethylpyrimidine-binding protein [Wukongibacter baidiensis]|uniref:YkoF family thiamine/hydroxymethylpyrimidine-binding protein n=1 Tax=Wukongibacter baidiensis TaxID=1723361 RepID=UPI003D7F32C3
MITAEVALYPLKTSHATNVIDNSINALHGANVHYSVNSMNTHITGTKEEVFKCLGKMFSEADRSGGEISMVVTITNASK